MFLSSFPSSPLPSLPALLTISVYVMCVCVFSSLMFLACQCNGASVVSRACCPWIAPRMPVLLDRQVQFAYMSSTHMFFFFFNCCVCRFVHLGVHVCLCTWVCFITHSLNHVYRVHLFNGFTSDCFRQSEREKMKSLACCCSSVGYL